MKKLLHKVLLIIFIFGIIPTIHAKVNYTRADSLIYEDCIHALSLYKEKPINELVIKAALYFTDKPYVAHTLEKSDKEVLTVNLREFDCTTFVENCIVLSQVIKSGDMSFDNYCHLLMQLRYRNGVIEDYASRLHYVTDWIFENERNGLLQNISKDLGGEMTKKPINFVSNHPNLYKQISENADIKNKIKKSEEILNKMGNRYVINKELVRKIDNRLKNGDIVAFSTTISGLDFTHIGIIYADEKLITFIHASSNTMKVNIERKSLAEYCAKSKKCDGIAVLRLN